MTRMTLPRCTALFACLLAAATLFAQIPGMHAELTPYREYFLKGSAP